MKLKLITPLLMLLAAVLPASSAIIKGKVVDGEGESLPGASLQLVSLPDTVSAGFLLSDTKGAFTFKNVKPGNYYFAATMVGMDGVGKEIAVSDTTKIINLGNITLLEAAVTLKEAVVTAIRADVVTKQDTIEFNAGSFHTAPNATVNDLLKKLPGVEIGSDGSITSNGKSITKILIDGKEFFGDDPQMATKNLPSNMVDRVQVVDRKSDFARMTGVDDGEEETVINLTVKKDMNNGWFGNVSGGYGTDDRYQGSFVINRFSNGNQITLLGGANNINDRGFSDRGAGNFRGFGGSSGIEKAQRFGLNFNVGNGDKFRVGGNVLYSHTDRVSSTRKYTQNLLPDSVSYQSSNSLSRDKGHNVSSDFRIKWEIDEYNTFEFRPNFSINFRNSMSNDSSLLQAGDRLMSRVNRNRNDQTNKGTNVSTGGNLIFNHKFANRPGRSMSFQINYSMSNNHQKSTAWNDIEYYRLGTDSLTYRFSDNKTWNNNVRARVTWTEPLGDVKKGNFLQFSYRLQYRWNNADKFTYNLPNPGDIENFVPVIYDKVPEGGVLSEQLSNSFRNNYFNQEIQAGYRKVSKKMNFDAGVLLTPSMSKSIDRINDARNIPERWVWNVSPYARMRFKYGENSSLRLNYRGRTEQPSMSQLQPVADVSNPLNIKVGNPDLKPTFTHRIEFNLHDYRPSSMQALMVMFNASYTQNTIVTKTTTNRETGGRTTTYTNENGNTNIFGMVMLNRPLRNRRLRFNLRMNGNYTSNPGYINGEFNRTDNLRLSPSAGFTFSNEIVQISVNPSFSWSQASNSLPNQANRITKSYGCYSWGSLDLPFGLAFNYDLRYSDQSGMSAGYDSRQTLLNTEITYSFLSDRSLTFSAKAYDLLGQKKSISRSVSANSIVDSESLDLTRYFMFSLTYNFNTLKKKGKGPTGEDVEEFGPGRGGRGPMGPPPGGGRGGWGGGRR